MVGQVDITVEFSDKSFQKFSQVVPHNIYPDPIYGFLKIFPKWNMWERQSEKLAKTQYMDRIASGDLDF